MVGEVAGEEKREQQMELLKNQFGDNFCSPVPLDAEQRNMSLLQCSVQCMQKNKCLGISFEANKCNVLFKASLDQPLLEVTTPCRSFLVSI